MTAPSRIRAARRSVPDRFLPSSSRNPSPRRTPLARNRHLRRVHVVDRHNSASKISGMKMTRREQGNGERDVSAYNCMPLVRQRRRRREKKAPCEATHYAEAPMTLNVIYTVNQCVIPVHSQNNRKRKANFVCSRTTKAWTAIHPGLRSKDFLRPIGNAIGTSPQSKAHDRASQARLGYISANRSFSVTEP